MRYLSAYVQVTLILLHSGPKASKSSDAGNLDRPKRSHKALPLSEKVKVLNLIRKKNHMLRLLRPMIRMNLLSVRNCEEEKKMCASFAVAPQTAKITAIVRVV